VVLEGLKPGERVIVDNLARLRPDAPVTPAGKAG
jgi:multidrug efflux pump subunit AcrA (membrane-fusion protein)